MAKPGAKRKPSTRKISERKKPALRAVPAAVPSVEIDPREIDRLKAELAAARVQIAELEARADIDPLLDILNRRGFERELARSLAYVKRYGTDAVLLYIDLDDFKAVNDNHGHAAGDELLKAVTAALTSQVRASDVIGRLGGDEFAVVLWNMSVTHAAGKARALEDIIAGATITRGAAKTLQSAPLPGSSRCRRSIRRRRRSMPPTARCMCANARSAACPSLGGGALASEHALNSPHVALRLAPSDASAIISGVIDLEPADLVAQDKLPLLQPLYLNQIGARRIGQSRNGGVEVAVFLLKARQLVAQLALFVFGHRHQPGESRPARVTAEDRSCQSELSRFPQSHSSSGTFGCHKGLAAGLAQPLTRIQPSSPLPRFWGILSCFKGQQIEETSYMSMQSQLADLEAQHRSIEAEINDMMSHPGSDDLKIHELKRRKLQLKDEIARLRQTESISVH